MNNKDVNLDLDEYQLNDEGEAQTPPATNTSQDYFGTQSQLMEDLPKPPKNTKIKRLLVPVGLVVVIFLVYNFLNWYSTKKTQSEIAQEQVIAKKEQQVADTNAVPPQQTLATTQQPTPQQQAPKPMPALSAVDLAKQQADLLAKQEEANKEQLNTLSEKLSQNQEALLDLNKRLEELTTSTHNFQTQILAYYAKLEKPKKVKKVVKQRPLPLYRVHAIVPGRAWLESSDGDNITVTVGNKISGYGMVEMISPRQGMVVMSSGTIFQYGVNDF